MQINKQYNENLQQNKCGLYVKCWLEMCIRTFQVNIHFLMTCIINKNKMITNWFIFAVT